MSTVTTVVPAEAVELILGATLGGLFESDGQLRETLIYEVTRDLAGLLDDLGLPGTPSVGLAAGAEDLLFQPVRVVVGGQTCRYPRELLWLAYSYARRVQPNPAVTENEISDWLRDSAQQAREPGRPDPRPLLEFVRFVAIEALKVRPSALFGREQADAYLDALLAAAGAGDGAEPPPRELLTQALRHVLDLRISIADRQAVGRAALGEAARAGSAEELGETLGASLRPDVLQVLMSPQYLREVTLADDELGLAAFAMVREQLSETLGLTYPRFEFSTVEDFEPGTFAFRLNHVTTAPYVGLAADEVFVLDSPVALQELGMEARGALHPLSGAPCSVIKRPAPAGDGAEPRGPRGWNQMQYVALTLLSELRWKSGYFLDRTTAKSLFAQLGEAYPALAAAVGEALPEWQLSPVLRSLVAEDVSCRHLRAISERLLDYRQQAVSPVNFVNEGDSVAPPAGAGEAPRETVGEIVSFIRSGIKRYVAFRFTDNEGTLNAYLLDDDLQRLLLGLPSSPEEAERVAEPIRRRLNSLPAFSSRPVILTSTEIRSALSELLRDEFPWAQVVSYDELTINAKLQIVERIPAQD